MQTEEQQRKKLTRRTTLELLSDERLESLHQRRGIAVPRSGGRDRLIRSLLDAAPSLSVREILEALSYQELQELCYARSVPPTELHSGRLVDLLLMDPSEWSHERDAEAREAFRRLPRHVRREAISKEKELARQDAHTHHRQRRARFWTLAAVFSGTVACALFCLSGVVQSLTVGLSTTLGTWAIQHFSLNRFWSSSLLMTQAAGITLCFGFSESATILDVIAFFFFWILQASLGVVLGVREELRFESQ